MLLDTRAILAAVDLIEQETGNAVSLPGKPGCFPTQTQCQQGLAGDFEAVGNRETEKQGGVGCGSGAHTNSHTDNTQTPAPPESSFNRAAPQTPSLTVSLVSLVREPQYQQGLAGDFCGKQPCFQAYPVFPVSHLDDYAIQERAAILEYDAGMTRAEAEAAVGLR
jgi:hypothetical protein